MQEFPCVFLVATNRARRYLVSISTYSELPCQETGLWMHGMVVDIGTGDVLRDRDGRILTFTKDWTRLDTRWIKHCSCGYTFTPDDFHCLWQHIIYERQDTKDRTTIKDAPIGSIWLHADDLFVRLPDEVYKIMAIDYRGRPPLISCRFIQSHNWIGEIRDGLLLIERRWGNQVNAARETIVSAL